MPISSREIDGGQVRKKKKKKEITWLENSEDRSIPLDARAPPKNVVIWMPILSVRMPEIGDKKNVVPMVNDPTKAETKARPLSTISHNFYNNVDKCENASKFDGTFVIWTMW